MTLPRPPACKCRSLERPQASWVQVGAGFSLLLVPPAFLFPERRQWGKRWQSIALAGAGGGCTKARWED